MHDQQQMLDNMKLQHCQLFVLMQWPSNHRVITAWSRRSKRSQDRESLKLNMITNCIWCISDRSFGERKSESVVRSVGHSREKVSENNHHQESLGQMDTRQTNIWWPFTFSPSEMSSRKGKQMMIHLRLSWLPSIINYQDSRQEETNP